MAEKGSSRVAQLLDLLSDAISGDDDDKIIEIESELFSINPTLVEPRKGKRGGLITPRGFKRMKKGKRTKTRIT
ncbi:MAG: hypothetical protein O3C56_07990 [Bacteroidetes bacterium]|jgi:hypothetical protein|nr:hypothetical protein [Bacteroidota bacterium]|tara:strand:- start:45 stop:266 length:222 start_codon:yes stop_codon:yes gene_type:complete